MIDNQSKRDKRVTIFLWIALVVSSAVIFQAGAKIEELERRNKILAERYDKLKLSVVEANEQADREIRKYLNGGERDVRR